MPRNCTTAFFRLGRGVGMLWYADSTLTMRLVGQGDHAIGAARLAATSPRCGLPDNIRRALRGHSPLPCHAANLARVPGPLRGPKVEAFRRALLGDTEAVPWDVWMLRAYRASDDPGVRELATLNRRLRRHAHQHQTTPRDFAASVWCGIILHHGRQPLTYDEALWCLIGKALLP